MMNPQKHLQNSQQIYYYQTKMYRPTCVLPKQAKCKEERRRDRPEFADSPPKY